MRVGAGVEAEAGIETVVEAKVGIVETVVEAEARVVVEIEVKVEVKGKITVEAEAGVDLAGAAADEESDPVDAVLSVRPVVARLIHAHIRHLPDQDTLAHVPDHFDLDPSRNILAVQGKEKRNI